GFTADAGSLLATVSGGTSYVDPTMSAGTWYYRLAAFDAAGNVSNVSAAGAVVVPDIQAPTAPGTPTASVVHQTVTLTWTGSTDDVGVTGYDIYRSGTSGFTPSAATLVASVPGLTYDDGPGAGTWYYLVLAHDAAGNASAASGAVSAIV